MIKQREIAEHILLHLQDIRKELSRIHTAVAIIDNHPLFNALRQLEYDMYEIGEHLGFSPAQVNGDKSKHI